ncbi:hypothetical protein DH2020_030048 [Rehmannia glutinosa]|uniref:DUF659 domain-containing protein n=1 Tax=Rehmannia glutinosa TaxID=99300 RepID=A0ABR0VPG1_REHGL
MRNKTDDVRKADRKSHGPNLPMKRNWCPKMDTINPELTQKHGPENGKRRKNASPENSEIESSSFAKGLKNPQEYIIITDDSLMETKKNIGRFFYESGLDFDAVNLPSFQRMISLCSDQTECHFPTCQELKGWIFKDVMKEVREYVDEIRNSWAETGCSILLDEWTDEKGRNLVNILVDSPRGTVYLRSSDITDCVGFVNDMLLFLDRVIMEVGINNVVQIMTNSTTAFMNEVGKQLMEKYRPICWTFSASSCIELMLEKLEGIDLIKETLEKTKIITQFIHSRPDVLKLLRDQIDGRTLVEPSKIRSAQPYLILDNIVFEEENLKKMFLSSDFKSKMLTSTMEGKQVADLVADRSFWSGASMTVKGVIPLVRVIDWMNKKNKEQIGYIYETIDQAKEMIKKGFNKKSPYEQFWKAIDEVWDEFLYSPLHSACYYLNPNLFYSTDVYIDSEVTTGLCYCIVKSTEDLHVKDRMIIQMEKYRTAKALWWSEYGIECPELQRLAIRILSQTCDGASKFRLKRSLAETLLTKGRTRIEQKRLTDMVFLQYNMRLRNFASGMADYITSDQIDLMDDWIVDKTQNNVSENDDKTWMDLDGGSTTDQGVIDLDGPSCFCPKVEIV